VKANAKELDAKICYLENLQIIIELSKNMKKYLFKKPNSKS